MTTKTEDFCRSILQLPVESAKPLANLVMALASYSPTHSVVGLSQSPLYHYQYSSINQTIHRLAKDDPQRQRVQQLINQLAMRWVAPQTTYCRIGGPTHIGYHALAQTPCPHPRRAGLCSRFQHPYQRK